VNRTDPPRAHDKRGLVRTACPLFTGRGAFASRMATTDYERRLDIAAAVLARGVRRVLGADLTAEHGAVERENDALPVRATEAVMGAASNQEKTTR
jgi:hypothetical protein